MSNQITNLSDGENYKVNTSKEFINKIQNVYITLTFETFFCLFVSFNTLINENFSFYLGNFWIAIAMTFIAIMLPLSMISIGKTFTKPFRYLFLSIHIIATSYVISYFCNITNPKYVLMTVFMTFCLLFALSFFVAITKSLLNIKEGCFFISFIGLVLFSIFSLLTDNNLTYVFISTLWIVLLGVYIVYDTLLMNGNNETKRDFIDGTYSILTDYLRIIYSIIEIIFLLSKNNEQ
jgi:FtsH-binding integral membrane protein